MGNMKKVTSSHAYLNIFEDLLFQSLNDLMVLII